MERIRLHQECVECLLKKCSHDYPDWAIDEQKTAYTNAVRDILLNAEKTAASPELMEDLDNLKIEMFGEKEDFTELKHYFNEFVLSIENEIWDKIQVSQEPLKTAIQYAMMGNYIDFGAVENVTAQKLVNLIKDVNDISVNEEEFAQFKEELEWAERLVYLTDNCGEIVFDKIFIRTIREIYPNIKIDAIVRGKDVLNDATMVDAEQIGLTEIVPVMSNGSGIAGTSMAKISAPARKLIEDADIVISKGMGNFETLRYTGMNIYYIFMAKCHLFANMFNVPLFTGMFINDLRME